MYRATVCLHYLHFCVLICAHTCLCVGAFVSSFGHLIVYGTEGSTSTDWHIEEGKGVRRM